MRRLLLLALALVGLLWWLFRVLVPAGRRSARAGGRTVGRAAGDSMVRDRVCNTFLPRSRALSTRVGSDEFFFCSERCRDRFLAERAQDANSG